MTKIKICGLFRAEDVSYVNEALPDYVGFVFAESKRRVTDEQAAHLRTQLDKRIVPVGVFVSERIDRIAELYNQDIIQIAQLHGDTSDDYISKLKTACPIPIIKAIPIEETGVGEVLPDSSGAAIEKSLSGSEDCLSAPFARVPQELSVSAIAGAEGEPAITARHSHPQSTKLIANLPYAVAATIVLDYFEKLPPLQSATVMVQKEVADRMAAQSGTKDYGAYTIKLALFAQPTASFGVSRTNFLPPPRVDSTVIRLDRHENQPSPQLVKATFTVIEAAFAERRKTIRNSMRSYFSAHKRDPEQVDALLEVVGILPTVRGETLKPEVYLALGEAFNSQR
jgi:16S rRNA A1518/A1519 N6-dimethyltransferase RsmA/KsgA/DIM1 with predicted DNA glycosylase/AP lyase activity